MGFITFIRELFPTDRNILKYYLYHQYYMSTMSDEDEEDEDADDIMCEPIIQQHDEYDRRVKKRISIALRIRYGLFCCQAAIEEYFHRDWPVEFADLPTRMQVALIRQAKLARERNHQNLTADRPPASF